MGLSRKRKREMARLRSNASRVWDQQKEVLEHASHVVRQATRQAARIGREDVAPRIKDTVDNRIKPRVASGVAATRYAATATREKLVDDVLPAVSSALGSAIAVMESAKDPRVRAAAGKIGKKVGKAGAKAGIVAAKSSGPGRYILMAVVGVAIAGIGYATWQTLRADDELWVADDLDDLEPLDEL